MFPSLTSNFAPRQGSQPYEERLSALCYVMHSPCFGLYSGDGFFSDFIMFSGFAKCGGEDHPFTLCGAGEHVRALLVRGLPHRASRREREGRRRSPPRW